MVDQPQTIAVDDLDFLDRHDAVIQFRNGHVYIDLQQGPIRAQYNGFTIGEVIRKARAREVTRG